MVACVWGGFRGWDKLLEPQSWQIMGYGSAQQSTLQGKSIQVRPWRS